MQPGPAAQTSLTLRVSLLAQCQYDCGHEVLARIGQGLSFRAIGRRDEADPASLFETEEGVVFGIIASDTAPFCGLCDRLRLTADGRLRGCLYENGGVPLGAALKSGTGDEELLAMMRLGLRSKRSHHPLGPVRSPPIAFSMADTGG